MTKHREYILAGTGGQGLVMMGVLLGRAASDDGYHVAQSQSYGIAARGGVSYSEVVISPEEIVYPKVTAPELILALTEETYRLFRKKYPKCKIVVDADEVAVPDEDTNTVSLSLTGYCRQVGDMRVLNLLAIGVVVGFTGAVSREAIEKTICDRFPRATEANLNAFYYGVKMAQSVASSN